jgi:hypothetical protein
MLPKERPLILHPTYSFSQATAPNEGEENIRRTFLYRDLLGKETGKQSPFQSFSGVPVSSQLIYFSCSSHFHPPIKFIF